MQPLYSDSLQDFVSQSQIRDVLHRYAVSLDSRDFAAMRSCFTPDVKAVYNGVQISGGVEGIVELLQGLTAFERTMHLVGTIVVNRVGEQADVLSYTVAHLMAEDRGSFFMLRRGVRYVDKMVQLDGMWRISERVHSAEWSIRSSVDFSPELPEEFR